MRISTDATVGYAFGSPRYAGILDGLSSWSWPNIPGATFTINADSLGELRHASPLADGMSVIARVDPVDRELDPNVAASTWLQWEQNPSGPPINYWTEVDILVNDCACSQPWLRNFDWVDVLEQADADPSNGYQNHYFRGDIRHEAGHVLGLEGPELFHLSTMTPYYSLGSVAYDTHVWWI